MRKQYKKARYKRAAMREADRKYPGIKAFRRNMEELRKAMKLIGTYCSTLTKSICKAGDQE